MYTTNYLVLFFLIMGLEINLLKNYPKTKRDSKTRARNRSPEDRKIARRFDKDFFDGDRKFGYGGFVYNEKYWKQVVRDIANHYQLKNNCKILDVGCGKGFMLYDFYNYSKNYYLRGIDISDYAIQNAKEEMRQFVSVGNAKKLDFEDNYFDLVISINTVHNLDGEDLNNSLKEIERVSKKNKYIIVDAFSNDKEQEDLNNWNLTAKTILHTDEWKKLFDKVGYTGDYYWFRP